MGTDKEGQSRGVSGDSFLRLLPLDLEVKLNGLLCIRKARHSEAQATPKLERETKKESEGLGPVALFPPTCSGVL